MEVDHGQRAVATFEALQRRAFDRQHDLYGERRFLRSRTYEALWPYANAWSAVATLASIRPRSVPTERMPDWLAGLICYHEDPLRVRDGEGPLGFQSDVVPPLGLGGDLYYDDNAWLGLAACRQHRLTDEAGWVVLAKRLSAFVLSGWSDDPSWTHPGGIAWKRTAASRGRNTCVNGPAAELALELAALTGDPTHAEWGMRVYEWVRSTLCTPEGLYADHLAPDGTLDRTIWSYNQGTMIGAGVLLASASGDKAYLDQAVHTAATAVSRYEAGNELEGQLPAFNAIFFRNLFLLDRICPDPTYRRLAVRYADSMWTTRRRPNGCFSGASLVNATAPMIEIEALLAGAMPRP